MEEKRMSAAFTFSEMMDWVEAQTGATVNFDDAAGITHTVPRLKLSARQAYHHSAYCEFAKRNGNHQSCCLNKRRSKSIAQRWRRQFCGYCPFGVWDLAQPVVFRGQVTGIIYVGSLRGAHAFAAINGQMFEGRMASRTEARVQSCRQHARLLAQTMVLIIEQWVREGNQLTKQRPTDFYVDAVAAIIDQRYEQPLRLSEVAEELHVHPNYLGQLLKRETGRSFRQLLCCQRIEKAKVMLSVGKSVTDTAFACGFSDGNYFSTVFRRETGMTPSHFAKQHQKG